MMVFHGFSDLKSIYKWRFLHMGMDQYLLIPFLVGWTSIFQLFWCSPGVQGFDTLPYTNLEATPSNPSRFELPNLRKKSGNNELPVQQQSGCNSSFLKFAQQKDTQNNINNQRGYFSIFFFSFLVWNIIQISQPQQQYGRFLATKKPLRRCPGTGWMLVHCARLGQGHMGQVSGWSMEHQEILLRFRVWALFLIPGI